MDKSVRLKAYKILVISTILFCPLSADEDAQVEVALEPEKKDDVAVKMVFPDGLSDALKNMLDSVSEKPTLGPTLSPKTRHCQAVCGDGYYTCAMMKCEGINVNDTKLEDIVPEDDKTDSEIEDCWTHCREAFTECFDKCKPLCEGKNCVSATGVHTTLKTRVENSPLTPTEYKYDWNVRENLT